MREYVPGRELLVARIVFDVRIDPVVREWFVEVPFTSRDQLQREDLDNGFGQRSDLEDRVLRRGNSGVTLLQLAEDFCVREFSILDDADADSGNIRFLHPVGKLLFEIKIKGLCGLGLNLGDESEQNYAR